MLATKTSYGKKRHTEIEKQEKNITIFQTAIWNRINPTHKKIHQTTYIIHMVYNCITTPVNIFLARNENQTYLQKENTVIVNKSLNWTRIK